MTPKGGLTIDSKARDIHAEIIRTNFTPKQGSNDKERRFLMPNSVKNIEGKKIVFDPTLLSIGGMSKSPKNTYYSEPQNAGLMQDKPKSSSGVKLQAPATTPSESLIMPLSIKGGFKKGKFGGGDGKKSLMLNIDEINKENPFGGEMCEKPAK